MRPITMLRSKRVEIFGNGCIVFFQHRHPTTLGGGKERSWMKTICKGEGLCFLCEFLNVASRGSEEENYQNIFKLPHCIVLITESCYGTLSSLARH